MRRATILLALAITVAAAILLCFLWAHRGEEALPTTATVRVTAALPDAEPLLTSEGGRTARANRLVDVLGTTDEATIVGLMDRSEGIRTALAERGIEHPGPWIRRRIEGHHASPKEIESYYLTHREVFGGRSLEASTDVIRRYLAIEALREEFAEIEQSPATE